MERGRERERENIYIYIRYVYIYIHTLSLMKATCLQPRQLKHAIRIAISLNCSDLNSITTPRTLSHMGVKGTTSHTHTYIYIYIYVALSLSLSTYVYVCNLSNRCTCCSL